MSISEDWDKYKMAAMWLVRKEREILSYASRSEPCFSHALQLSACLYHKYREHKSRRGQDGNSPLEKLVFFNYIRSWIWIERQLLIWIPMRYLFLFHTLGQGSQGIEPGFCLRILLSELQPKKKSNQNDAQPKKCPPDYMPLSSTGQPCFSHC